MSNKFKDTYRCYLIDHHSPAPPIVSLSKLDVAEYEQFFKTLNIDSLMLYCKDHWGYSYYDTKVDGASKHSGLKIDFVGEISKILRKLDIEFVAYYCIEYDVYAARTFPQWRVLAPDGTPVIRDDIYAKWPLCCAQTGYREYLLSQLCEIVANYTPDSLFLDIFGSSLCYCDCCKDKFKAKFGKDLPADVQSNSGEISTFLMQNERELLEEIQHKLKAIDPTLAITINFASHYPAQTSSLLDYHFCEPVLGDNWYSAAYTRDTAVGKFPLLMPGEFSQVYNYRHENTYSTGLGEIAAQGCRVGMYSGSQHVDGTLEHEEARRVGKAFNEIEKMHPYITGRKPMPYVGIIQSDASKMIVDRTFPQDAILRLKRSEPHMLAILGAMKLCEHAKLPWQIVPDNSSTALELERFGVILLPEVYIISKELIAALYEFVKQGGCVIASANCGIYGENLNRLEDSVLCDLLGVHVGKTNTSYQKNDWGAYITPEENATFLQSLSATTPPICEQWNEVTPTDAQVLARYIEPCVAVDDNIWINWWSPPPAENPSGPALTRKHIQNGQVYYCGFDLFAMASNDSFPYLHELFSDLVVTAFKKPPIYLETGYKDIIRCNFSTRGNEIIVHQISTLPKTFNGECPQISGGTLHISKDFKVNCAKIVYPQEIELTVVQTSDGCIVQLPEFSMAQIATIILK